MNEKIANSFALLIAVQIGILPVLTIFSQTFNIFSIAINFVCVPLFETIFVVTLATLPICLLFPFLGFVLKFLEFIYAGVTILASFVGRISWANLPLPVFCDTLIISTYTSVFIASNYIKIHKKIAYICLIMAAGLAGVFVTTAI